MITSAAVAAASFASAQTAPSAAATATATATTEAAPAAVQELVVTGSRIPQPNLTSVSPLTTVTANDVKLNGSTDILQLLNELPAAFANQTSQVSNGSTGTAEADLRNLGPQRTLVLVDGKRLMPGDPSAASVNGADLNNIPTSLVDRVDVVTGGASAVYGSDAVAGVINFIMKKNFEGVQVDYQYSFDNHQNNNADARSFLTAFGLPIPKDVGADGGIHSVSIILGTNAPDDKGNITAYATYRHTDPILQGTRDFSDCGIATYNSQPNVHHCIGSSNTAFGRFDTNVQHNPDGTTTTLHTTFANNPNGTKTFAPYTGALAYNFNPLNFIQREDEQYTAGFFAHYEISKLFEVYTDFMFMDDQTNAQIAPSGLFRNSGPNLASGYTINCNNPLLGTTPFTFHGVTYAGQAQALGCGTGPTAAPIVPGAPGGQLLNLQSIGYRFAAVPRNSDITHTDYKIDVGLRGDLGSGWSYDAYLQLGVARVDTHITGYGAESKIANALNVVYAPGTTTPVCVNGGPSCVPLDIFAAQSANITQAAYNYVLASAFTTGQTRQQVANINLTGDLGHYGIKSPWAADGVGINIGAEYRRDYLQENFDTEQQAGDLSGGGGQLLDTKGAVNVKEVYFELRVPVAHDMPFIKDLTFDTGYRFSHYDLAGDNSTYKFGVEYKPIDDLLLRASYNHAVRAPNVQELFAPVEVGLAVFTDPCALNTNGTIAAPFSQCKNTGMTAAQYGVTTQCPSSQCSAQFGGGAFFQGLKPEDADTYTVGFVYQPSYFPGFSFSMDYFDIKVNNVISTGIASPSSILASCLASATSPDCALIVRDPITGGLDTAQGFVKQLNVNAGFIATDGIDFSANYHMSLPDWFRGSSAGSMAMSFVGTWTDHLTAEPFAGSGTYDCAGLYGAACSNQFGSPVTPHFKSETRITWNTPWKLTASLQWRYIGPVTLDYLSTNPLLNKASLFLGDQIEGRLHSYNYFDLAFTYKVRDNLTLRAGCNNLFDIDPPTIDANNIGISGPPFGNANTFPGVYDSLGRNIFIGLTANF
ncbi:MAG TPA: TonB-dependent receptor [Caulobacteraceae bacterium]|nr:TonB-dependent receptor [Caulobacteraceae bacterium]